MHTKFGRIKNSIPLSLFLSSYEMESYKNEQTTKNYEYDILICLINNGNFNSLLKNYNYINKNGRKVWKSVCLL